MKNVCQINDYEMPPRFHKLCNVTFDMRGLCGVVLLLTSAVLLLIGQTETRAGHVSWIGKSVKYLLRCLTIFG